MCDEFNMWLVQSNFDFAFAVEEAIWLSVKNLCEIDFVGDFNTSNYLNINHSPLMLWN